MPRIESDGPKPGVTPRRWPRSALMRWGYPVGALFYLAVGVDGMVNGSSSHLPAWFPLLLSLIFGCQAYWAWKAPVFEVTHAGVRWPGSKGVVPWADLKPVTVPPDDGWTHTVFVNTVDGREHVLPKMKWSELEAPAQQIRDQQNQDVNAPKQ